MSGVAIEEASAGVVEVVEGAEIEAAAIDAAAAEFIGRSVKALDTMLNEKIGKRSTPLRVGVWIIYI